jgi:hypothetical protein
MTDPSGVYDGALDGPDEYLGDGVHAGHDGWHIVLSTAQRGPIYLDPAVLRALIRYAVRHGVVCHTPQEDHDD